MKYLKMLGLLATAAAALTAFASTASATTATSPKGTVYTGTYKAEAEGKTSLHTPFAVITCGKSTVEGKVEQHGTGVTTTGKISLLTFTECNSSITVLKTGSLEAHTTAVKGTDADGTLTSSGAEVTVTILGVSCLYTTGAGTDIGTGSLTSTTTTGGNATLDVASSAIPRTGHSAFCGSSGTWTGSYKVVTPSTLYIDA
jgi:hypothetical protein